MTNADSKYFGALRVPRLDWLNSAPPENALEPQLPIIDAHHHLWDIKGALDGKLGGADQRYLVEDFSDEIAQSGHKVIGSVYIQGRAMYRTDGPVEMRPVGEVEFANGCAAMSASGNYGPSRIAAGIVGCADMRLGHAAKPVLEALQAAAPGRFRGIRYFAAWDADPTIRPNAGVTGPGLYKDERVRAGIACLGPLGMSLDCMLFYPQLPDMAELAQLFPDIQMIVGHNGGLLGTGVHAERKAEAFQEWRSHLQQLAQYPNVNIKLGGMTIRLAAFDYHNAPRPPTSEELANLWRPYVETCIETFGAERCMFESNFPVDKMGVPYATLINAFKRILADASPTEKQQVFNGTARRVYRLDI